MLAFVGEQLLVPPAAWLDYDLKGRSSQRDREQIRAFLGFRPITVVDAEQLQEWLQLYTGPLYRWYDDRERLQVTDKLPRDRPYETVQYHGNVNVVPPKSR